jgi:peptidoglycan/LPS O-acetylase OafA/YrhL
VSWSRSVEVAVNITWFAAVRFNLDRTWAILVLWIAILAFFLSVTPTVMDVTEPNYLWGYVNGGIMRCALSFCAGILLARHADMPLRGKWVTPLNLLALLCLASFAVLHLCYRRPGFPGLDYFEVAVVFPLLVLVSINGNSFLSWPLRLAPLTFLGTISFSIYILHKPMDWYWQLLGIPQDNLPWTGWYMVAVTLALSTVAYFWIEQPARRAINKLGVPQIRAMSERMGRPLSPGQKA